MNADLLLRHFDRICEAPDAVPRLRRFILDLAMRGKLVDQDPNDVPASELLQRIINTERMQMGEGSTEHLPDDMEFDIPQGWIICRLEDLAIKITDGTHKTPNYVEYGIPFISVKDFSSGRLDFSNTRFISESEHRELYKRCDPRKGDILIGRIGTLGKAVIVDTDKEFSLFVSVGLIRVNTTVIFQEFLRYQLNSPFMEMQFNTIKVGGGTHTNKLNLEDLRLVKVILPPLEEQHRIVAKIDELMSLCDELEAAQAKREKRRDRLVTATLHVLNNGDANDDTGTRLSFRDSARFYFNHLPRLTTRPEHIRQLRQTILNLAIRGRLVEQDPEDEPAYELLKRIETEKLRLIAAGEIRRQQPLPPVSDKDTPYSIPASWVWVRLGNIGDWGSGCTPPRGDKKYYGGSITWLKSGELDDIIGLCGSEERINEDALKECSFRMNKPGDVLIAMYGATIGKLAILGESAVTNQAVCGCTPFTGVYNRYLFLYLLSQRDHFRAQSEGGAQPNISKAKIINYVFPLPPYAEQHRIVTKVDELMTLCDELETGLINATTSRGKLLEAVLKEALAG